jgi:hypothetical protein
LSELSKECIEDEEGNFVKYNRNTFFPDTRISLSNTNKNFSRIIYYENMAKLELPDKFMPGIQ